MEQKGSKEGEPGAWGNDSVEVGSVRRGTLLEGRGGENLSVGRSRITAEKFGRFAGLEISECAGRSM
jgi:hypothetical protein